MAARTELSEGQYALINGRVGIIRDTSASWGDTESNGYGWRRFVLRSLSGMPEFNEIQIDDTNWPFDALSPEALVNIIIRFTAIAAELGVVLAYHQEQAPDGRVVHIPHLHHQFVLTADAFRAFEQTVGGMAIRLASSWCDIAFYRLFGADYDAAIAQYSDSSRS
jgi:hypothetical protein